MRLNKQTVLLILIGLLTHFAELHFYPGILANKFSLALETLTLLVLALIASKTATQSQNLALWPLVVLFAVMFIPNLLDAYYFDNYFYSKYRYSTSVITSLISFSITIYLYLKYTNITNSRPYKILGTILAYLVISNTTANLAKAVSFIIEPASSLNHKYTQAFGNLMEFTTFINQTVPPGETVAIPSNRVPFKYTSKATFLQYFVYPRKVVEIEDKDIPKANWLLITSEESPDHNIILTWPQNIVLAHQFYIYNFDNKKSTIYAGSFRPDMFKGVKPWGLIQK